MESGNYTYGGRWDTEKQRWHSIGELIAIRRIMEISIIETQENCPVCDGLGVFLGTLGNLHHYTCQDCGIGFNSPVEFKLDEDTTNAIGKALGL